jgi:hypothetical protein
MGHLTQERSVLILFRVLMELRNIGEHAMAIERLLSAQNVCHDLRE